MDVLGPMETCFMPLTYLLIEVVGSPGGGLSGKTRSGNNTDAYSGISFRPGQNELAEADLRSTTVGCYPDQANGFGLLDTGTGSMEKVQITVGKLRSAVNQVREVGGTTLTAYVHICGKVHEVFGGTLGEL